MEDDPAIELLNLITSSWKTQAICTAARLRVPNSLEPPASVNDLAQRLDVNEDALSRLLRALISLGICIRHGDGLFGLTEMGQRLRKDADGSLHNWAMWWGQYCWPEWGELPHSIRTGQSARQMLQGTEGFNHLHNDTDAAHTFNQAMMELTSLTSQRVASAYDFSKAGLIVDVGGGAGQLLREVLLRNPDARGQILDMAHAETQARETIRSSGLEGRCEFTAGDFFKSVPGDSDIYILKSILHDWSDADAGVILTTCHRSMPAHAKLLVCERVVPDSIDGEAQDLCRSDLHMLVALGGRERTMAEMSALLTETGFAVEGNTPVGVGLSLLECRRVPR